MCMGIGIVVVVPEDGPMQFFGRTGNSSHDTILHEMVPIELHNRVAKIEYTYPHALRLDAPDEVCRQMALDLGVAEAGPFGPRLNAGVVEAVLKWIAAEGIEFDLKTLQGADLREANLREANLLKADLLKADLLKADLREADLREADLQGADLREADLRGADLQGANLWGADLQGADLREADLRGADLQGANLRYADLQGANLWGANLRHADLRGADLWRANLQGANLWGANLRPRRYYRPRRRI